jgi:mono/diheme cytochrome c family protein
MNQIKYLVSACLILITVYILGSLLIIVANTEKIKVQVTPIDYPESSNKKSPLYTKGKVLYQQNCASCHAINRILSAPALADFENRGPWNDKENIYKWISNPAAFMESESYTKALLKEYSTIMPAFPNLTKEDIDAIIDYINRYSGPVPTESSMAKL